MLYDHLMSQDPWVSRGGNTPCFGFISIFYFFYVRPRGRVRVRSKRIDLRMAFSGRPGFFFFARPFVCAIPSTTKTGPPACACVIVRFTYEVTFVHLPGRGDLTCTHRAATRARAPSPYSTSPQERPDRKSVV